MEHQAYLNGVRTQIAGMAAELAGADLRTSVPSCPDWDLAELILHTGRLHRWVSEMARTGATEYVNWKKLDLGLPADPAARPAWLAAGAEPLTVALDVDPTTPLWSFAPGGSAGWWARRQLHETTVHRTDGQLALGLTPEIPSEVALDGVEELLGVMFPAVGVAKRVAELDRVGDSLHLHATDAPGEWTITLTPDGYIWDSGHAKATVAVRGTAADLYLLLWNRRRLVDAERFATFGDAALIDAWLSATGF
jgi:uncharacterized protein (TIGR03083 family)